MFDPDFRYPSFFSNPYEEEAFDGLNFLLEMGKPFDFPFEGHNYRISIAGSSQKVSLWEDGVEQPFPGLTELMEGAVLDGRPFQACFYELPLDIFL